MELRRMWQSGPLLLAAAMTGIVTTLVTVTGPVPSAAQPATNRAIEWNSIASTVIIGDRGAAAARGSDQHGDGAGRRLRRGERDRWRASAYLVAQAANPGDSTEAAVATAALRVLVGFPERTPALVGLVPTQRPTLQVLYDASLANVPDGASETGGVAVGEAAAAAMLTDRLGDGRGGTFEFVPGSDPGIGDWDRQQGTAQTVARDPARGLVPCGRSSCRPWRCSGRTVRTT